MAFAHSESCFKLIVSLFLVICNIDFCILEAPFQSKHNLFSSTTAQFEDANIAGENASTKKKGDFARDILQIAETGGKFGVRIEIRSSPGKNSSCRLLEANEHSVLAVEKNNCNIVLDKLDNNIMEILNHLEIFCEQDQHFLASSNTRMFNESKACELKKQKGNGNTVKNEVYAITTRNSTKRDLTDEICQILRQWNVANTKGLDGSICITVSDYYFTYEKKKCCTGSFNFIPRGALQVEAVMLWLEKDGYSHIFEVFYFVSFSCVCIIFVSGLVSRSYRSERGNQILMHFAFSICAQFVLHMVGCSMNIDPSWCDLQSILSHYFTLVESCWTSIIAYLQYKRYVKVFDHEPNHLILKLCAIAYLCPTVPISFWILFQESNRELVNYLTFALPEFCNLLINSTLLVLITRNIVFVKNEYIEHRKSLSMEVKLIFFLFFVLDFSWFDIILAHLTSNRSFILIFLFTQSLQGFMLFFVFGIMNEHNRFIYKKFFSGYVKKIFKA